MIPLVDLNRQYKTIQKQVKSAVQKVIDQTDFILGKEVSAFEEDFAKFCQVKYAVGVDSGTGALELAMHSLSVKPGDEIIVPVFTFYATASSAASLGAKPVFVDIEEETGNMDPTKLEQAITSKTRAIIPVHLFGQPVNMPEILKIANKHNLPIIEDACQAHGAEIEMTQGQWKKAGSIGRMGCFSFYPGKNLGAYGDGGMVVTNEEPLAQKLKLLRDYGRTGKYRHDVLGFNRRLDTIQAAILRVKLKKLASWNESRKKHANLYNKLLSQIGIQTFKTRTFVKEVRHVYAIRAKNRDELSQFLKENGIATGVHYPIPLHMQKAFEYLNYKEGDFPIAENIAKEILSLPIFPELKDSEIKKIVDCIAKFNFKKL